jgi:lysophospholipase L1-like esterase
VSRTRANLSRVRIALATLACALGLVASSSLGATPRGLAPPSRTVLDLGDSLSVGTDPYLRKQLRGYRIDRLYDVGLHAYDAATIVARSRASLPTVVVVSAGTNDDPRTVSSFARAISDILRATGRDRCVVWPTISRPPAVGSSYDGLNRALTRAAARHRKLVVVDWVGMVRRNPSWLSRDGVHVSVAGYRARAAAIATAVKTRCGR